MTDSAKRDGRIFIIAEAGVNHNGDPDTAKKLIDVAVAAGADAVKFQAFLSNRVVIEGADKAGYQKKKSGADEDQREMLRKLKLDGAIHSALFHYCQGRGIEFMSTAFDLGSLAMVKGLGVKRLKISSGEIISGPLLLEAARTGLPIIMSTGASTLSEVESALEVLAFGYLTPDGEPSGQAFRKAYETTEGRILLKKMVTLLHCTSQYPAPLEDANLKTMTTLSVAFGLRVGYSDHTLGFAVPVAAAALGATVIEKHFTLNRAMPGPDHAASLEPVELAAMVNAVREVEAAMGDGTKIPAPSEQENIGIIRKSLVASRPIAAGDAFTVDNLDFKRPGVGVSPMKYWEWLGRTACRDYIADEIIDG